LVEAPLAAFTAVNNFKHDSNNFAQLLGQHIYTVLSKLLKLSNFGWESLMDSNIHTLSLIFKQSQD
jgi:hypothetical protein